MAATFVDKLVKSFKRLMIPSINGKPTYVTIKAMHELLNSNAASVTTNLGCGKLVCLCLTLSPTVYTTLSAAWFVPPANPGAMPVIPTGTTRPKAASIRYAHNAATLAFKNFRNVDRALRQQLLGAVEDNFVQVKHRPHQGYIGSSMLYFFTHLYKTYSVISNSNWIANNKHFREAYAPTKPIDVVWRQIDDAVAYADASSTPYLSKQVLANAYQIVFNTGISAAD